MDQQSSGFKNLSSLLGETHSVADSLSLSSSTPQRTTGPTIHSFVNTQAVEPNVKVDPMSVNSSPSNAQYSLTSTDGADSRSMNPEENNNSQYALTDGPNPDKVDTKLPTGHAMPNIDDFDLGELDKLISNAKSAKKSAKKAAKAAKKAAKFALSQQPSDGTTDPQQLLKRYGEQIRTPHGQSAGGNDQAKVKQSGPAVADCDASPAAAPPSGGDATGALAQSRKHVGDSDYEEEESDQKMSLDQSLDALLKEARDEKKSKKKENKDKKKDKGKKREIVDLLPGQINITGHDKIKRNKLYEAELQRLQEELVKLQAWIKHKNLKVVVIFEGRDAAGKGGVIKRITERLNPRICRVCALGTPTEREKTQWYFQRYIAQLPAAGEMVLFDRSWYNRAGVERVMGFCSDQQYWEFMHSCPIFEEMLIRSGIILLKYWFSVSDEVQEKRFQERINDNRKRWKLSPMDLESRNRWVEYSHAKDDMVKYTDTELCGWHHVPADDKKLARLNCISHLLSSIPYGDLTPQAIVLPPREFDHTYIRPPQNGLIIPSKYR